MIPSTVGFLDQDFEIETQPSLTYKMDLDGDSVRGLVDEQEAMKQMIFRTLQTERYAYFLELRKNWSETSQTIVRVSQIENRILGVDGVVDVTGTKLNGTASNMTLTEFCIPKLGGVSA